MPRFLASAPKFAQRYWKSYPIKGFSSLQWRELAEFAKLHCQGDIALHEEVMVVLARCKDERDALYAIYRNPATVERRRRLIAQALAQTTKVYVPFILFQEPSDAVLFRIFFPEQFER